MRHAPPIGRIAAAVMAICVVSGDAIGADAKANADISCRPAAEKLQYDCTIKLTDARTNEPLTGIELTVGADMSSMPMAHNVRPAKATAARESGTYQVRIVLEMHGDWALRLDLAGPVRDRIIKPLRFEDDRVIDAPPPGRPSSPHKH
jgi:YtkA-like protein